MTGRKLMSQVSSSNVGRPSAWQETEEDHIVSSIKEGISIERIHGHGIKRKKQHIRHHNPKRILYTSS